MGLDFSYPWALLLAPAGVAAVWLIDRRYRLSAPSLKRKATLWARTALVIVLALAIAAPSLLTASGQTIRWILLDVSDSAKASQKERETAVAQALSTLPMGEQVGMITFGNGAMVEKTPSAETAFSGVQTVVKGDASSLDDALLLANALTPADGAAGITVVSDGNVSVGQAAAGIMTARGMTVDSLTYAPEESSDAQISQLLAPSQVYEGQSVTLEAVIDASAAMSGTLALYQNGVMTASREITLQKGENRFAFRETAQTTGVVTYEARLLAQGDSQSRNNSAAAYVRVSGAPKLLLVSDSDSVKSLYEAAGMMPELIRPAELPAAAEDYLAYDAVILNNVDFDAASEQQWTALDSAVRTLGRGLCVLGGDQSYALGGYRGTVLEELLPVRIDVKNKLQLPSLSLIIAIDKSGSMTTGQYGTARIEVAKEAAISALQVLTERDFIGVIGFDEAAKWVVPFQQVTDAAAIESMIGTLRADGGTAFYSALQQSLETLRTASTAQKHVIFLSDGQPGDSGFEELVAAMRQENITVTTVAVGSDADQRLMYRLSSIGGGRSYQADEFSNVPKIFAKETMMAGGSYVQNRVFTPVITETSALTDFAGFPSLTGYLSATDKDTAVASLVSDTEDPLLARWNVGAGKVISWLSDAQGAWTESFLRWDNAAAFFGGMAAAVIPGADREGVLDARVTDDQMNIVYTTEDRGEDELITEVTVIAPDGSEQTVPLHEVEPGVYEGAAQAEQEGAYAFRLTQAKENETLRTQESGAVKSYAGEYDLRENHFAELPELVTATGGRTLQTGDGLWDSPIEAVRARQSLRTMLLWWTLCLLLLDIALRKLSWEDKLYALLGKRQPEKTVKPVVAKPKPPTKGEKAKEKQRAANETASALLNAQKARRGE
ncbi:MAG: VWA domain-containing protein [Eubacteriales bacterium]|nr:VWA domain-containing protein [Eubacteriales bacterium]